MSIKNNTFIDHIKVELHRIRVVMGQKLRFFFYEQKRYFSALSVKRNCKTGPWKKALEDPTSHRHRCIRLWCDVRVTCNYNRVHSDGDRAHTPVAHEMFTVPPRRGFDSNDATIRACTRTHETCYWTSYAGARACVYGLLCSGVRSSRPTDRRSRETRARALDGVSNALNYSTNTIRAHGPAAAFL